MWRSKKINTCNNKNYNRKVSITMKNEILTGNIVTNQDQYISDELIGSYLEWRELQRRQLYYFERTIMQMEAYLFQQMPIIQNFFSGEELYLLIGGNFEEATASIWITIDGYAVVSENGKPIRYYQFQSANENVCIHMAQLEIDSDLEEQLVREINNLKERISLCQQFGVQLHLITDELLIRRLNKQMP